MKRYLQTKQNQTGKQKDRGSAMIVAIIVSLVVVAFCLSLLVVAYSLFASSNRKITEGQCGELAKTVSIELEKELTDVSYSDFDAQKAALDSGKDTFWQYLRYNICQDSWPYYDETTAGHDETFAYRYFDLNMTNGDASTYAAAADNISVCVYWADDGSYVTDKDGVTLYLKVTCAKGEQTSVITSKYELTCDTYDEVTDGGAGAGTGAASGQDMGNTTVNPSGNVIDKTECWRWSLLERE